MKSKKSYGFTSLAPTKLNIPLLIVIICLITALVWVAIQLRGTYNTSSAAYSKYVQEQAKKAKGPVSDPKPITTAPVDVSTLKGVTYWDPSARLGCADNFTEELAAELPGMKDTGFNAVWLVSWWECFSTRSFPTPQWDAKAFQRVRDVLAVIKQHNMKAILPLNYVANIPGTTVDFCSILRYQNGTNTGYGALKNYVQQYLTEIQQYSNDVVIMLFTEGMICDQYENPPVQSSALLRNTLGRLPLDLPPTLRSKFTIGFHDFVFRWSEPAQLTATTAPTPTPSPYNFFSFAYYITNEESAGQITHMDQMASRLRSYYGQNVQIFNGELGASYCVFSGARQASLTSELVQYARTRGHGFSLWQWKGFPCGEGADGFYLNDPKGNPLPARTTVKKLLTAPEKTIK